MSDDHKFPKKIPRKQALELIQRQLSPLPEVLIPVTDSSDRIAAHTLSSSISLPEHDRSAMDGFAVSSNATRTASPETPVQLSFSGEIRPSATTQLKSETSQAVRLLTGGIVPHGTDAVVPFENVEITADTIKISSPVGKGRYIRNCGSDILKGETIVSANQIINPCQAALLAYAGVRRVPVRRNPKISVLAVGNELCDPASDNAGGLIPADNLILIKSLCKRNRINDAIISICENSPQSIAQAIHANNHCDLIITTGGTGPGNRDFVFNSVLEAGGIPVFKGLAMHPAKSIFACKLEKSLVIGLPGPPNAVNLAFHTVIKPIINILLGIKDISSTTSAILKDKVKGSIDREKLRPCLLCEENGQLLVDPLTSGKLSPRKIMNVSNGIIILPPDCGELKKGNKVSIIKFT